MGKMVLLQPIMNWFQWSLLFLVLVTHRDIVCSAQAQSFDFPSFRSTEKLLINADSQHMPNTSSIWLQPSYNGSVDGKNYSCGDVIYADAIQMRNSSSAVASFSTSFTFSMTGRNSAGMAFMFITGNRTTGSAGACFCLLPKPRNGDAANHVFAVEFDTWRNPEFDDPSDNHIGVNVNSMNSSIPVYNLCGIASACEYLVKDRDFTAWIDYNSTTQALAVYFTIGALSEGISKPATPIIQVPGGLNLTAVFNDYMYVGITGSGAMFSEVKKIKSWSFQTGSFGVGSTIIPVTPAKQPESSNQRKSSVGLGVIAGAVAAGCGFLVAISCVYIVCWRRRRVDKSAGGQANNMDNQNLMWPREFSYQELNAATKGFSKESLLGEGGFGQVFRGALKSPNGGQVAVKRTKMESAAREFLSELSVISQIRHRNLIRLFGWCQENNHLLLVFEYMPNSSLERWLFDTEQPQEKLLSWPQRQHIMTGVAAALAYLHEGWSQCVLHRDIKAANVLLDEEFNPHVGDFGLARLTSHNKLGRTTVMAGTIGYLAPETAQEGKVTQKSDVYSFGILALEVASGRPVLRMNQSIDEIVGIDDAERVNLLESVWQAHERGELLSVVDPRLLGSEFDPQQVRLMFELGLLCSHPDPEARPVMRVVHRCMVDGEVARLVASLPQSKPRVQYYNVGAVNRNVHSDHGNSSSHSTSSHNSSAGAADPGGLRSQSESASSAGNLAWSSGAGSPDHLQSR